MWLPPSFAASESPAPLPPAAARAAPADASAASAAGAQPRAAVAAALLAFHRRRADLEDLTIDAVHAMDDARVALIVTTPGGKVAPLLVLYNWQATRVEAAHALFSPRAMASVMWYASALDQLCGIHVVGPIVLRLFCSSVEWQHVEHNARLSFVFSDAAATTCASACQERCNSIITRPRSAGARNECCCAEACWREPVLATLCLAFICKCPWSAGAQKRCAAATALPRGPVATTARAHAPAPVRALPGAPAAAHQCARLGIAAPATSPRAHPHSRPRTAVGGNAAAQVSARRAPAVARDAGASIDKVSWAGDALHGYRSFEARALSLLCAASLLDTATLRHFLRSQLPGTCAQPCVSPYADPRLFVCRGAGTAGGATNARWHTLSASDTGIAFHDASTVSTGTAGRGARADARSAPAFELDCRAVTQDGTGAVAAVAAATGPGARRGRQVLCSAPLSPVPAARGFVLCGCQLLACALPS